MYQLPGTNAVDAAKGVRKLMEDAKKRFPQDVDYVVALDTTESVTEGIRDIVITIGIAILLVTIVVYLFLQGWRATLIPLLAVPVSLIGTFMLFPVFGFSINTLSLFGLVLAIGLVVDDAIVVVEAVERHMEEGMAPKQAALKAMEEISGPVIGIALVLSAVFVPTVFIPGITGRLYQQFAVTIAISVILSAFNALTLSPALAALLLKPKEESHGLQRRFFDWFNRMFARATNGYIRWSGALIRKSAVALAILVVAGAGAAFIQLQGSGELPARRGSGLYVHAPAASQCIVARTHRSRGRQGRGNSAENARREVHHSRRRLQFVEFRQHQLYRSLLRHARRLEGPHQPRNAVSGDRAARQSRVSKAAGRIRAQRFRRPPFLASGRLVDSPSFWKIAPGRMSSFFRATYKSSWPPRPSARKLRRAW